MWAGMNLEFVKILKNNAGTVFGVSGKAEICFGI